MARVLYTSAEVHAAIQDVLADPHPSERRVVLVAYVGSAAAAYLPSPRGLQVVCSPQPGSTSGRAVRELIHRGAEVRFSDRLHMKVYWSSRRGCVITSANVSARALAKGGLHEAGVLFPAGTVKIERLLATAKPRAVTPKDLRLLDRTPLRGSMAGSDGDGDSAVFDFRKWYESTHRQTWKLGWWEENNLEVAKAARTKSEQEYGVSSPEDSINGAPGDYQAGDWLLCFEVTPTSARYFSWMYVNFVVRVDTRDRKAYQSEFPFQAIQVSPARLNPEPPFRITPAFRTAFRTALQSYGPQKVVDGDLVRVPKGVLDRTYALLAERPAAR